MVRHEFGGEWTREKLERVRKYLHAYTTIFTRNPQAQKLLTFYVDAFAGTGYRDGPSSREPDDVLFPELVDPEAQAFLKGSARIALEVEPSFNKYIFIEKSKDKIKDLEKLRSDFPSKANYIEIVNENANGYLKSWCERTNWTKHRAVVFLDPYGMQVEWSVIESLAQTKAVDLWILFPLGIGVSRLLTKSEPPPQKWSDTLTRIFGSSKWQETFYPKRTEETLFGPVEMRGREADFIVIGKYFVKRLKTIFPAVAENPLPLRNSKNNPMFLLCFAAGNPKASVQATALRIAKDILKK